MKLRCLYCSAVFDCDERPPACPACGRTFSITVGPGTTVKEIVRAVKRSTGGKVEFALAAEPDPAPMLEGVAIRPAPAMPAFLCDVCHRKPCECAVEGRS